MKVKEESEKVGLKLNIQKTKIMASDPITSRQIEGKTTETVTDFIFLGSKITADGDCSHEIKRHLLLGRKVITQTIFLKTKIHHLLELAQTHVHQVGDAIQLSHLLSSCPSKIKYDTVSTVSPSISHEVMGPDTMILVF